MNQQQSRLVVKQSQEIPFYNPTATTILSPNVWQMLCQTRQRVAPGPYNGQRMDEIFGGQISKEYSKAIPNFSQTVPPNIRNEEPQPQRFQKQFDPVQDRFTPQEQRQPPAVNPPQRPMSQRRPKMPLYPPIDQAQKQPEQQQPPYQPQQRVMNNQSDPMPISRGQQDVQNIQDQMVGLEKMLTNEIRKNARQLQELEREMRTSQQPLNQQILNDVENKIFSIESRFLKEERMKNELQQKILLQEQNTKELMYLIKNLQSRDNNDMLQMRGMIQEKITEEGTGLAKEREKSKALFMEVVRLGEGFERLNEQFSASTLTYESRIQQLEAKIYQGEKALVQVSQKNDTGYHQVNEWSDKLERRVMMIESNLITLGKEQLKDRDQLVKVDTISQRTSDEMKGMLYSIQQDYTTRLEARVTEVVNRIIMEHEQRVKSVDEIRTNMETREKMNLERAQYEREEMRERLQSLEGLLRNDSARKEEAIRQLSTLIESQVAAIYSNIKNEEAQRYAHEIALRNDLLKIQENIKEENELFKSHQSTITEKITDMIRVEVQTRLSSDVDLKNLTSAIASDIVTDLNSLKDTIDAQNKKIIMQLKDIEKDSSDKAEKLSHYVDEEVSKLQQGTAKRYDKMKIVFTKLAEQFKQHLINTETNKQEVETRLKALEVSSESMRLEFQGIINDLQEHLLTRIAEDKQELIITQKEQLKTVQDHLNKVETEQNKNFGIMKEAIEENHNVFTQKMQLMLEQNEANQKKTREQVDLIVQGVQLVRQNIIKLEQQLREQVMDIQKLVDGVKKEVDEVQLKQKATDQKLVDQEALLKAQGDKVKDFEDDIKKQNESIKSLLDEIKQNEEQLKQVEARLKAAEDSNSKQNEELKKTQDHLSQIDSSIQFVIKTIGDQTKIITDLQVNDTKLDKFINDEIIAKNKLEFEAVKANDLKVNDRLAQLNDLHVKRDIELKDIHDSIKIMQDKIKTLTKLEN